MGKSRQMIRKIHLPPPLSHCRCPGASVAPPPWQPWTTACSLPAQGHPQDHMGSQWFWGWSTVLSEREGAGSPSGVFWQGMNTYSRMLKWGFEHLQPRAVGRWVSIWDFPCCTFCQRQSSAPSIFKNKYAFILSKDHLKLFKTWVLFCLSFAKKMYIAHHLYRAKVNTFSQP